MTDIFFKYKTKIEPTKGCLLISEPYLPDPNFQRTVILLCEYNEEGAFGFVLNRPSEVTLNEIIEVNSTFKEQVFVGGPVQHDTLHFLHTASEYLSGGTEVYDRLFWGGDFEQLTSLIDTGQAINEDFRFFVGYSGWGPQQLDVEIEENSWILAPPLDSSKILSTPADDLWQVVLKNLGGRFEMFSKYPSDPRLN
jgi:putative transcriptional regulator